MDESGTDEVECSRNVTSGRSVAVAIRSLVNARNLQLECTWVLHESLLVPNLTYGSENDIEGGEVYDQGCTDGQLHRSDGY